MNYYISDKEIEDYVPTRYWEEKRGGWSNLSDIEKARALVKKVIYRLKLIKQWVYEIMEYVSLPIAIDIFFEEAEKEGMLERNSWNKDVYRTRRKKS